MGLTKYIRKYKDYEKNELDRRKLRKAKLAPYRDLSKKKVSVPKTKKKFSVKKFTKVIGNPYGVKFPESKKIKKIIKKARRKRKRKKVIVIYK